jgi:flagellar hook-associated protein 3 FlgL
MRFDPNYIQNLSQAITAGSASEQKLTAELASGLRVSNLSDDPVAVAANTQLASSIAHIDSFVQSAGKEQSLLQVTDSTLGEVVTQVTSALSLAVSATNGTLNAANRSAIAQQVSDLRDSIVSLANTSYQGKYLFSGSQGNTRPFTQSTASTPAVATYKGDAITTNITTPEGLKVQTNLAGSAVFQASGADLLGSLNQLVTDISSGSSTSIAADTAAVTAALQNVSSQRSVLGSSLNRLNSNSNYAQTQKAALQVQQSSLLSADTAQVATDLKSAEVQRQALLSVVAAVQQNNLFNYLK